MEETQNTQNFVNANGVISLNGISCKMIPVTSKMKDGNQAHMNLPIPTESTISAFKKAFKLTDEEVFSGLIRVLCLRVQAVMKNQKWEKVVNEDGTETLNYLAGFDNSQNNDDKVKYVLSHNLAFGEYGTRTNSSVKAKQIDSIKEGLLNLLATIADKKARDAQIAIMVNMGVVITSEEVDAYIKTLKTQK